MERFLSNLIDTYRTYFDIESRKEGTLRCIATYNSRTEGYILTKRARMWSMKDDEYVLFHLMESLDDSILDGIIMHDLAYADGAIVPDRDHRSSMVTTVMVCRRVEPKSVKRIRYYRHHRNFRFMLNGWMDHRLVLLSLEDGVFESSRLGKEPLKNAMKVIGR